MLTICSVTLQTDSRCSVVFLTKQRVFAEGSAALGGIIGDQKSNRIESLKNFSSYFHLIPIIDLIFLTGAASMYTLGQIIYLMPGSHYKIIWPILGPYLQHVEYLRSEILLFGGKTKDSRACTLWLVTWNKTIAYQKAYNKVLT